MRRRKHEPIPLTGLTVEEVATRTGRVFGSKFDHSWTLARLVDWIERVVTDAGWRREPGVHRDVTLRFDVPVGISEGRAVYSVKVVNPDGMYVHACRLEPADDRPVINPGAVPIGASVHRRRTSVALA